MIDVVCTSSAAGEALGWRLLSPCSARPAGVSRLLQGFELQVQSAAGAKKPDTCTDAAKSSRPALHDIICNTRSVRAIIVVGSGETQGGQRGGNCC